MSVAERLTAVAMRAGWSGLEDARERRVGAVEEIERLVEVTGVAEHPARARVHPRKTDRLRVRAALRDGDRLVERHGRLVVLAVAAEDPRVRRLEVGREGLGIGQPLGHRGREAARRPRVVELALVGEHRSERDERALLDVLRAPRLRRVERLTQRGRRLRLHPEVILHVALHEERVGQHRLVPRAARGPLDDRGRLRRDVLVLARVGADSKVTDVVTEQVDLRALGKVGRQPLHRRRAT